MIHLSDISINPASIAYIKWNVNRDCRGLKIKPSVEVAMIVVSGTHENPTPACHYIPLDSSDVQVLKEAVS